MSAMGCPKIKCGFAKRKTDFQSVFFRTDWKSILRRTTEIISGQFLTMHFCDVLVFEAKAGETYTASIRDKRKNAGAAYVYLVEIAPLQSSLTAFLPRRSKLSQAGQTIAIPRGSHFR